MLLKISNSGEGLQSPPNLFYEVNVYMSGAYILHPRGAGCTATEDLALHRGDMKFVKCMRLMVISHPPSVDYISIDILCHSYLS